MIPNILIIKCEICEHWMMIQVSKIKNVFFLTINYYSTKLPEKVIQNLDFIPKWVAEMRALRPRRNNYFEERSVEMDSLCVWTMTIVLFKTLPCFFLWIKKNGSAKKSKISIFWETPQSFIYCNEFLSLKVF